MFGNHPYQKAMKIAAEKSKELGKDCIVVPATDHETGEEIPGLFTVGVPVPAMSGSEFQKHLRAIIAAGGAEEMRDKTMVVNTTTKKKSYH